ncbi:bifunctional 2-polyprenyl-6-hydroxyphenol methylase/3-demethylubiquinol 3-O-methyltransferase UbiG [Rhodoferax sp. 4810]|uniref:Ubiquinone biosynthesis O-methyltransferase n=1 Tax=Thiospirillum jenense TaxID=1653858 RepID=A0A839HE29_9GAMM|nr:bifunctional 2-polyprenyl-6-hydroxyphenol methylase/3-demethylubiquinol 3-O-methyltransferase UbiG [Thiospirillum jenense]MBB1075095.1 bifunctional 2-polyprenyl-6-hydroxyphenol methylase/3-demethylubiquinol 3-O-methyltransferase UbiG [Rhodoferax jenense]MBB1126744.1 bifunctional 2-polyprenyl-6-hydroxyphenol methylase/3-demethylubiquinol 3-O-methyltransferase UbiG [Thiospirillum jenense]
MTHTPLHGSNINPREVAYFERLAHRWWDEHGPFWPLHRLNAFRVAYLRQQICRVLGRIDGGEQPFAGLRILDIGCGGGILSESMARLGARVTAIDVAEKNIQVSQLHAATSGLEIDYQLMTAEQLVATGATFDVVLNMEVVEHVDHLPGFLTSCGQLVRPGGVMFISTINRTFIAWLMVVIGAEYILRWLPRGTHHYAQLVKPKELIDVLGRNFRVLHQTGVRINPFTRRFRFSRSLSVNYMMVFERA